MPRFRFNWEHIDGDLAGHLAASLKLAGPPADALRSRFGARPKEDFIGETWAVLMDKWLAVDEARCAEIAATLRERNLGDTNETVDMKYLRSCRNTAGLRRVVLPVFITMGELAPKDRVLALPDEEDTQPRELRGSDRVGGRDSAGPQPRTADSEPSASGEPDGAANSVEHLRSWLIEAISGIIETDVEADDDGDIPVPYGSTVLFVSSRPNPLHVEIFSPLVRDLPVSPELLATLNNFNATLPFARLFHHQEFGGVMMSVHLTAQGLSHETLGMHIKASARLADHIDTSIQEKFGGQKLGQDERPDEQLI